MDNEHFINKIQESSLQTDQSMNQIKNSQGIVVTNNYEKKFDTKNLNKKQSYEKRNKKTILLSGMPNIDISISDLALKLRNGLHIHDHKLGIKIYHSCFMSEEAVAWLCEHEYAPKKKDAILIGQELVDLGIIIPLTSIRTIFKERGNLYQFRSDNSDEYKRMMNRNVYDKNLYRHIENTTIQKNKVSNVYHPVLNKNIKDNIIVKENNNTNNNNNIYNNNNTEDNDNNNNKHINDNQDNEFKKRINSSFITKTNACNHKKMWYFPPHIRNNSIVLSQDICNQLETNIQNKDAVLTQNTINIIRERVLAHLIEPVDPTWKQKTIKGKYKEDITIEKPSKKTGDYSLIRSSKVINYPCVSLYNDILNAKDRRKWERRYERGMTIEMIDNISNTSNFICTSMFTPHNGTRYTSAKNSTLSNGIQSENELFSSSCNPTITKLPNIYQPKENNINMNMNTNNSSPLNQSYNGIKLIYKCSSSKKSFYYPRDMCCLQDHFKTIDDCYCIYEISIYHKSILKRKGYVRAEILLSAYLFQPIKYSTNTKVTLLTQINDYKSTYSWLSLGTIMDIDLTTFRITPKILLVPSLLSEPHEIIKQSNTKHLINKNITISPTPVSSDSHYSDNNEPMGDFLHPLPIKNDTNNQVIQKDEIKQDHKNNNDDFIPIDSRYIHLSNLQESIQRNIICHVEKSNSFFSMKSPLSNENLSNSKPTSSNSSLVIEVLNPIHKSIHSEDINENNNETQMDKQHQCNNHILVLNGCKQYINTDLHVNCQKSNNIILTPIVRDLNKPITSSILLNNSNKMLNSNCNNKIQEENININITNNQNDTLIQVNPQGPQQHSSYDVNDERINQSLPVSLQFPLTQIDRSNTIADSIRHPSIHSFLILNVLGKGGYGKVCFVQHQITNQYYAMKILKKDELVRRRQVTRTKIERLIFERANHPFISRLYYAFQTSERLYMITDFMQGGDFFTYLSRFGILSERDARVYICEIILAVQHLHDMGIIYRDLKPENILICSDGHIKLTDFGLSRYFHYRNPEIPLLDNETTAFSYCGTEQYMAPEMLLRQGHSFGVDWWSLGIFLCEIVTGFHPFQGHSHHQTLQNIMNERVHPHFRNVSPLLYDLMLKLLDRNPQTRLGCGPNGISEILSHPFFEVIDWNDVYSKKLKPSYIPRLTSNTDLTFFDSNFTRSLPRDSIVIPPLVLNKDQLQQKLQQEHLRERLDNPSGKKRTRTPSSEYDLRFENFEYSYLCSNNNSNVIPQKV